MCKTIHAWSSFEKKNVCSLQNNLVFRNTSKEISNVSSLQDKGYSNVSYLVSHIPTRWVRSTRYGPISFVYPWGRWNTGNLTQRRLKALLTCKRERLTKPTTILYSIYISGCTNQNRLTKKFDQYYLYNYLMEYSLAS